MLIIKIHYGIGNQLFQYAFARSMSLRKGVPFYLDLHFYTTHIGDVRYPRVYQLNKFKIVERILPDEVVKEYLDKTFWERRKDNLVGIIKPYYKRKIVYEHQLDFDEHILEVESEAYLTGYWQDLRYFMEYEKIIRQDLTFKYPPEKSNCELSLRFSSINSVGIHIRRGDYLTDQNVFENVGFPDLDYYNRAMDEIKHKVSDPVFLVFTDDPIWVKQHFTVKENFELICNNDQERSYEDLRLLASCKHFIISNSSFGWWGAWLNNNKQKLVIGPKVWRKRGPDMYLPDEWLRM